MQLVGIDDFSRIENIVGIEEPLQAAHHLDFFFAARIRQPGFFLDMPTLFLDSSFLLLRIWTKTYPLNRLRSRGIRSTIE